jgi:uncharacterized iron-regulated membrane protein
VFRALVFLHRWVGIAVGWLMAVWCLSGVVMMYVPYPQLTDEQRIAALPPIDWQGCCHFADGGIGAGPAAAAIADATAVANFQVEMLGERPVLRAVFADVGRKIIDLRSGAMIDSVMEKDAAAAASQLAKSLGANGAASPPGMILRDQWTVAASRAERPFFEFDLDDPSQTVVYVSSVTGKAVQVTQSSQRFWNWLGSVPHWLYPTALRQYPAAWNQVVIWTSVIGTFLTAIGLYLGIKELRRRASGKLSSPHRGLMWWHHVPGLVFGVLVLTWVVSGLFSMNPWGMMEIENVVEDMQTVAGEPPHWSDVRGLIESVVTRAPADVRSLNSASFGGELAVVATLADGSRVRLDAAGMPKPLAEADWEALKARLLPAPARSSWSVLREEDTYHYSTRANTVALPIIRIVGEGTQDVRYYLDPISGRMVNKVDAGGRQFRWWHSALHTLDFSALTRSAWFRNSLMLALLLGAAGVCITGTWLGIRRLAR